MKILEDLNTMEDFSDLTTIRKIEGEKVEIAFIDFKYDDSLSDFLDTNFTSEINKKVIELHEKINMNEIKKSFVDNVKELAEKGKDELTLKKLSMEHVDEIGGRKAIYAKIINASNYISFFGKIGFASHMLISKKNFEKYEIQNFELLQKYKVIFDDSVEDIYLYKKNEIDQPGLILIYNEEKFEFAQIGSSPENEFIKVTLRK